MKRLVGFHKLDPIRIGGHFTFSPPIYAKLQTDGSFARQTGRCGAILVSADENTIWKKKWELGYILNSTEAQWASVYYGLRFALENKQECVRIENDNLGVVHGLTMPGYTPRHRYAIRYQHQIRDLASQIAWVGIRWIPRQENKADKLLR